MNVIDMNVARAEQAWVNYHERKIEDKQDRDERVNALQAEIERALRFAYIAGLNGVSVQLPYVEHAMYEGQRDVERTQPVWEAIFSDLDYAETAELLKQVMAESTCPLVHKLKVALAARYAENHASDLAELRAE